MYYSVVFILMLVFLSNLGHKNSSSISSYLSGEEIIGPTTPPCGRGCHYSVKGALCAAPRDFLNDGAPC